MILVCDQVHNLCSITCQDCRGCVTYYISEQEICPRVCISEGIQVLSADVKPFRNTQNEKEQAEVQLLLSCGLSHL